jgi:hypothetical protein
VAAAAAAEKLDESLGEDCEVLLDTPAKRGEDSAYRRVDDDREATFTAASLARNGLLPATRN